MPGFYNPEDLQGYEEVIQQMQNTPPTGSGVEQMQGVPVPPPSGGSLGGSGMAERILQQLQQQQGPRVGYDPNYKHTGLLDLLRKSGQTFFETLGAAGMKQAGLPYPGQRSPEEEAALQIQIQQARQALILQQRLEAQQQQQGANRARDAQRYENQLGMEGYRQENRVTNKGIPQALDPAITGNLRSQIESRDTLLQPTVRSKNARATLDEAQAGSADLFGRLLQQQMGGALPPAGGETSPSGEALTPVPLPEGDDDAAVLRWAREILPAMRGEPSTPVSPTVPAPPPAGREGPRVKSLRTPLGEVEFPRSPQEQAQREATVAVGKKKALIQAEREEAFRMSEPYLNTLEKLSDELFTETTWGGALRQGTSNRAQSALGIGIPKTWDDTVQAYLGPIARAYGSEKGVLTQKDIERIAKALPQWMSTRQQKDFAFAQMRQIRSMAMHPTQYSRDAIDPYITAIETGVPVEEAPTGAGGGTADRVWEDYLRRQGGR